MENLRRQQGLVSVRVSQGYSSCWVSSAKVREVEGCSSTKESTRKPLTSSYSSLRVPLTEQRRQVSMGSVMARGTTRMGAHCPGAQRGPDHVNTCRQAVVTTLLDSSSCSVCTTSSEQGHSATMRTMLPLLSWRMGLVLEEGSQLGNFRQECTCQRAPVSTFTPTRMQLERQVSSSLRSSRELASTIFTRSQQSSDSYRYRTFRKGSNDWPGRGGGGFTQKLKLSRSTPTTTTRPPSLAASKSTRNQTWAPVSREPQCTWQIVSSPVAVLGGPESTPKMRGGPSSWGKETTLRSWAVKFFLERESSREPLVFLWRVKRGTWSWQLQQVLEKMAWGWGSWGAEWRWQKQLGRGRGWVSSGRSHCELYLVQKETEEAETSMRREEKGESGSRSPRSIACRSRESRLWISLFLVSTRSVQSEKRQSESTEGYTPTSKFIRGPHSQLKLNPSLPTYIGSGPSPSSSSFNPPVNSGLSSGDWARKSQRSWGWASREEELRLKVTVCGTVAPKLQSRDPKLRQKLQEAGGQGARERQRGGWEKERKVEAKQIFRKELVSWRVVWLQYAMSTPCAVSTKATSFTSTISEMAETVKAVGSILRTQQLAISWDMLGAMQLVLKSTSRKREVPPTKKLP